jgi:hypothetical protein
MVRARRSRAEPVEGSHECGVGPCGGQDGAHVGECLLERDAEVSRGIERGGGRCAADRIDAMNQNGPTLSAQRAELGFCRHRVAVSLANCSGVTGEKRRVLPGHPAGSRRGHVGARARCMQRTHPLPGGNTRVSE